MPKISYFQRNGTVYVRHTHFTQGKSSDYTRSTGIKAEPANFDTKSGKVSRADREAPEKNEAIAAVAADIAKASRNLGSIEPTRQAMEQAVKEVVALRERQTNSQACLTRNQSKTRLVVNLDLEELNRQLADLEAQADAKRAEIREYELKHGINDGRLLTDFILTYAGDFPTKEKVKGGTVRKGEKALKPNTVAVYDSLRKIITDYKPAWRIDEVSSASLNDFQDYLLSQDYKNSSVLLFVRRVKSIVKHFADREQLDLTKIQTHKAGIEDVADRNIIALTDAELFALRDMELTTASQRRIRDQFVLMAVTSLRFSDLAVTREQVKGKYLVIRTEKKGKVARIPICRDARAILERYDYTIKPTVHSYFNKTIKLIGKKLAVTVPSLAELEEVVHLNGVTSTSEWVQKYKLLSAHVGRKTMISAAVSKKMSISTLKGITTHSKMDTMMNHYAKRDMNSVEEMGLVYEME